MTLDYDTAPEPIDYRECAWLWMSAGGTNNDAHMIQDFDRYPLGELTDAALEAWGRDPGEPLNRSKFIRALGNLRDELNQAGLKPGDPP